MKNIITIVFLWLLIFCGCASVKPAAEVPVKAEKSVATGPDFSEPSTWLLGYFSPAQLTREPYSTWYIRNLDDYMPDSKALKKLFDINKDSLAIKVVMGTWCSDSRREVPRLMRILNIWQFSSDNITFIGIDKEKNAPVGDFAKLDIQRVPTFIIYKNKIEAGRIIESPKTSLEQDLVNILTGMSNNK